MAPVNVPDPVSAKEGLSGTTSHSSILELGRSQDPFEEQIKEACSILDIHLLHPWQVFETHTWETKLREQKSDINVPKYEWTLNWLLKKLRAYSFIESACLIPEAWLLLRFLIVHVHPAKVGQLLIGNKYTAILKDALEHLRKDLCDEGSCSFAANAGSESTAAESNTLQDDTYLAHGRESSIKGNSKIKSKKRKRDTAEAPTGNHDIQSLARTSIQFASIAGTLVHIQYLLGVQSKDSKSILTEQLKFALNSPPEEAASVLGSAIYLLKHIEQSVCFGRFAHDEVLEAAGNIPDPDRIQAYAKLFVAFWETQSHYSVTESTQSRSQAFTTKSLLPCLLLLHTWRESYDQGGSSNDSAGNLESLIATNVIIPMRSLDLSEAITQAFFSFSIPQTSQSSSDRIQQTQTNVHIKMVLISLFFDIAIANQSKQSSISRKEAHAVLGKLFKELTHCAELICGPVSPDGLPKSYSEGLKSLVKAATEDDLQIDVATIESILDQATGLFKARHYWQMEWSLISLCLKNNADVFIVPVGGASGIYLYRKPNRFLASLLTHLDAIDGQVDDRQLRNLKVKSILIPLLHAFARVRDLPGFLEHWKEQLNAHGKASQRNPSDDTPGDTSQSLWEDDDLLNTAQELIGPSLSLDQLDAMLMKIDSHLRKPSPRANEFFHASELVMLDCVLSGCHNEDIQAKLSRRVRSIHECLTDTLCESSQAYGTHRWRIWRIVEIINRQWSGHDDAQPPFDKIKKLTQKAYALLNEIGDEKKGDLPNKYQEQSHAFSLMASQVLSDHRRAKFDEFSFQRLLDLPVNLLLKSGDPFWSELDEDRITTLKPGDLPRLWSGRSADIRTLDTLMLSCIVQLLERPSLLSCLKTNTQKWLWRLLSRQAVREKIQSIDLSHTHVSYSWLWSHLQRCEVLNEDMRLLKSLRSFQAERYLSTFFELRSNNAATAGAIEDGGDWKVASIEYAMAFESLQDAPPSQFGPEDRIDIANGLLNVLLRKKQLGFQSIAKHLQLLVKFADTPKKSGKFRNPLWTKSEDLGKGRMTDMAPKTTDGLIEKSMKVFQNIKLDNDSLPERSAVFVLSELIFGKPDWSMETLACEDALGRLTYIILENAFATLPPETSVQYLTKFYQGIGGGTGRASTTTPLSPSYWSSCSSMLLVTMTALNYYEEHRPQTSNILGSISDTIGNMRLQHFGKVLFLLHTTRSDWKQNRNYQVLIAIVECLCGYSDLLASRPQIGDIFRTLIGDLSMMEKMPNAQRPEDVSLTSTFGITTLRAKYRKLMTKLGLPFHSYSDHFSNPKSVDHTQDMIRNPGIQTTKHTLLSMSDHLDGKQQHRSKWLALLRAIIYNVTNEDMEILRLEASNVFHLLCRELVASFDFRESMLSLQCITLFIQRQPQIISQYHVDTVLSTITVVSGRLLSNQTSSHAAKTYIGLCRLTSALLHAHRAKLGGRYHLILPLLQSLLQILFIPYAKATSTIDEVCAFDETHAGAYARLLAQLSDPSPSAVGRSRKRHQASLNDETKREKGIVGQHLHYLVMTYCECQLTGQLAGDGMREVVERGFWAVLDCMGPEVMRTLNAGMDSSAREVWKRMYEDWKRYGHWQGE